LYSVARVRNQSWDLGVPCPFDVHANSLSIAGDTVASKDLFLFTYTKLHGLPPKVRGVLGEDYLRNFDVLIDYRHQVIQLESGLGSMAKTLKGEHLPVQLSGTVRGEPPTDASL